MTQAEFISRYEKQYLEWVDIRDEMLRNAMSKANSCRVSVSAYQVTLEQRKRMLTRGERMLTFNDMPCDPGGL